MDEYEERRKEWYAIAAESKETTVQCYKCPIARIKRCAKVEVSLELREMEKKYIGIRSALVSPSLSRIEEFKAKVAEMALLRKGSCWLLQYG